MKIRVLVPMLLAAAALTACGSGSSSTPAASGANPFVAMAGKYDNTCKVDLVAHNGSPGFSYRAVLTVTPDAGAQTATLNAWYQEFDNDTCGAVDLRNDLTVKLSATMLATTKTYAAPKADPDAGGVANVVELKYQGLTLSKGSLADLGLTSLPGLNASTKIAYLAKGNKLYSSVGSRGADGLGLRLSTVFFTKQ